jgi:hypothetical protein
MAIIDDPLEKGRSYTPLPAVLIYKSLKKIPAIYFNLLNTRIF